MRKNNEMRTVEMEQVNMSELGRQLIETEQTVREVIVSAMQQKHRLHTEPDVATFTDFAKIICEHWDEMKQFVSSYTAEELKAQFAELHAARNSYVHNNSLAMSEEACTRICGICTRIERDMKKVQKSS